MMTNKLEQLKEDAHKAKQKAEKAWYEYAKELDLGGEREFAFNVHERIRVAPRRF